MSASAPVVVLRLPAAVPGPSAAAIESAPVPDAPLAPAASAPQAATPPVPAAPRPVARAAGPAPQRQAARQESPRPVVAARTSASRDPDVDLVAALMAHVAVPPRSAAPAGAMATQPPQPQAAARVPARGTLDQRVQACKARHGSDLQASRACRRRVCEGQWGHHAACPTRLMPRPATTVEAPPARATPA